MKMGKIVNFDEYLKERAANRDYEIILFGETYKLPPSLPYQIVLFFKSLSTRKQDEMVDDEMIIDMFSLLFGKENVKKMQTRLEFDVDLMLEILRNVLEMYGVTKKADESDPKETPTTD